ncbi:MAG: GNAT family N-acetyltransferase [Candidatus Omnitrophica bacterium]|nr:GNAT family N-acetyltransferase [Candidatus Omnitrophota bacterium]
MKYGDYEIKRYKPKFVPQIANLERHLWSKDIPRNISYFRWKYEENPFAKEPVGVIALYKGRVVGFRGCFVSKWKAGDNESQTLLLSPADICVHPDHRRRGLFTIMTESIIAEFGDREYNAFINLSSNKLSIPGYLKMGWIPVADKSFIRRDSLKAVLSSIFMKKIKFSLYRGPVEYGRFGDIEVSRNPKADEMDSIVRKQKILSDNGMRLFKNLDFFRWRFQNNRRKYVFYYYWRNGAVSGYVTLRASGDNEIGRIIDYGESSDNAIEKILRFIIRNRQYDILNIWNINLGEEITRALRNLRFDMRDFGKRTKGSEGRLPILIRPLKKEYREANWFINEVDIRNIANWKIDEICSDAC